MSAHNKFTLKIRDYLQTPERKRQYNEQHFGEASRHYDFATRAMSLGRDAFWKRRLIDSLPPCPEPTCVDLACGTGDVAFLLAERYPSGRIFGIDLTASMLQRARQRNRADNVRFLQRDMENTGLANHSVDIVTGSYAVRNAPELRQAFVEIHRILKPGGCVALLDFSKPPQVWFQQLQFFVLKYWCGLWGLLLHGNAEVHSYIAASLRAYPDRIALRQLVQDIGFVESHAQRFYLGTLELLVLCKPGP